MRSKSRVSAEKNDKLQQRSVVSRCETAASGRADGNAYCSTGQARSECFPGDLSEYFSLSVWFSLYRTRGPFYADQSLGIPSRPRATVESGKSPWRNPVPPVIRSRLFCTLISTNAVCSAV